MVWDFDALFAGEVYSEPIVEHQGICTKMASTSRRVQSVLCTASWQKREVGQFGGRRATTVTFQKLTFSELRRRH
jgi:hypothetical protein